MNDKFRKSRFRITLGILIALAILTPNQLKARQNSSSELKKLKEKAKIEYFRALDYFYGGNLPRAELYFKRTKRLLLQALKLSRGREKHLISLGLCDIDYHLARINQRRGHSLESCRDLSRLFWRLRKIPKSWKKWRINLNLPRRIARAKRMFKKCRNLPSKVILQNIPKDSKIFLRKKGTKEWIQYEKVPLTLSPGEYQLKIVSPQYQTHIENITIKRWEKLVKKIALKPKPKPTTKPTAKAISATKPAPKPPKKPPIKAATKPATKPATQISKKIGEKKPPPQPKKRRKKLSPWIWLGPLLGGTAVTAAIITAITISQSKKYVVFRNENLWNPGR